MDLPPYIQEPPAIYQRMPLQRAYDLVEMSSEEVQHECTMQGLRPEDGQRFWACIVIPSDPSAKATIYLTRIGRGGVGRPTHDAVLNHEITHLRCPDWHDSPHPTCAMGNR